MAGRLRVGKAPNGPPNRPLTCHAGSEAPTREGLGAGGQRPSEKHGFFDYMTRPGSGLDWSFKDLPVLRRSVPGTSLVMCRSYVHSFWHDDPAKPEAQQQS